MATPEAVQRWDKVLDEVQRTRKQCYGLEMLTPDSKHPHFEQGFRLCADLILRPFLDAWSSDRPAPGGDLHRALSPILAHTTFDFTLAALPQVDIYMAQIADARTRLETDMDEPTAADIIAEIETLLKVTVLVSRVSHRGAMEIADREREERTESARKNRGRAAKFLDLNTMEWVAQPSNSTLSLAVFLAIVDPGVATTEEFIRGYDESDQPPIMKQFAAQWVVHFYTEWEEHFRVILAKALACNPSDIASDYIGDLKKMRQDYVHNRGICRNSARCKVLKWFKKNDTMIPTHANYIQLLNDFPSAVLATVPTPIEQPKRDRVPANVELDLIREFERTADLAQVNKDDALASALRAWIDSSNCNPD